jgi:Zn-dependent protease
VSTSISASRCPDCGADIATGLLACPGCARLVHGEELTRLAAAAKEAEGAGNPTTALGYWRRALELLPPGTAQHATIRKRMAGLGAAVDGRAAPGRGIDKGGPKARATAGAAAGVGTVGLALFKSKALLLAVMANGKLLLLGLTKIPTLLTMLLYIPWLSGRGAGFALGLVGSIYVHEIGHVAALKRYGIEASAPMFVPGFGALVRMKQYPTDSHEEARTGLAGPLWGLFAAAVAAAGGHLFASRVALAVASLGATINLFNLVPVWQLDGARGLRALSRLERLVVAAVGIAVGIGFHEWMPAVVGLVTGGRAFEKDTPSEGDRGVFVLFGVLLVALGALGTLSVSN